MTSRERLRDARTAQLAAATARRSEQSRANVRRALMRLRARGGPFDLTTVAAEARCSTSYLRKHPEVLSEIRAASADLVTTSKPRRPANASSMASLRTKLEVATSRLRTLEAELCRLRDENAALRGEVLELGRDHRR